MSSAADVEVIGVPYEKAGRVWLRCWELLEPALKRSGGRFTKDTLLHGIGAKEMQLWTAQADGRIIATWVTRINIWPEAKICEIMFVGGEKGAMPKWLKMGLNTTEKWATHHGCDRIEVAGRFGWKRALGGFGYDAEHIVMEKDLANGQG